MAVRTVVDAANEILVGVSFLSARGYLDSVDTSRTAYRLRFDGTDYREDLLARLPQLVLLGLVPFGVADVVTDIVFATLGGLAVALWGTNFELRDRRFHQTE